MDGLKVQFRDILPVISSTTVNPHARPVGISSTIQDPVLLDAWNSKIKLYISDQVFVWIVRGKDFTYDQWARAAPLNSSPRQMEWEISVGRQIRLRDRPTLLARQEDPGLVGDIIENIRTQARIGRYLEKQPLFKVVLRWVRLIGHV
jgi:hypothetical protein